MQVLTDTPLTIKNANPAASTTTNIVIPAGVKADVTLAGVNIAGSSGSPINMITNLKDTATGAAATNGDQIINKTTLHLTLADGSANTLNALGVASYPGLRCGEGSVLVVDDSRLNIDSAGNPVVPQDGKVGFDGTLLDGTAVKADDLLTVMESANPGSLTCYGGNRSSGIGGGAYENAGNMTFEGGIIAGYGYQHTTQKDDVARTGAGIGGGLNGGGTIMNFNGGRITAHGAYHSAGIGAGYGNQQYVSGGAPAGDAIARKKGSISATIGGNIYINGGFIQSTGGTHGNAFGAGCVSNNANHVIKVTGGTLLPTSPSGKDIGGGGGYVIITGGSVRVSGPTKFDGIGGTAYNTEGITTWEDITSQPGGALPNEDKVQMITVDLSPDIGKVDYRISHWELYVNGEKRDYGAPAYLDKGLLYLWLSAEDSKKPVEVRLSYLNDKNEQVEVEPIETRPAPGGGSTQAKRWIKFELDESKFPGGLVKPYDGLPIEKWELSKNPVTVTTSTSTRDLDDDTFVTFSYQFINADGTLSESFSNGSEMPSDTGKMKFVMQSTQYANDAELSKTYWGHETEGICQITVVPAVLTLEESSWVRLDETTGSYELVKETDTEPGNRLRLVFDIRSAVGTAVTCKAPTGKFQIMIDGKPVGDPIALTEEAVKASAHSEFSVTEGPTEKAANTPEAMASKDGRWKTNVTYYLDPTKLDGKLDLLESDAQSREHEVTVQYIPDKNYVEGTEANPENEASKPTTIVPVPPKEEVTVGGDKLEFKEDKAEITKLYSEFHASDGSDIDDFFKLNFASTSAAKITYVSSNPAVADIIRDEKGNPVLDEDGNVKVQVFSCGTAVITMTQGANAIYSGQVRELTLNVLPDPSLKPRVQIRLTSRNLTALAEDASLSQPALAAFTAVEEAAGAAPEARALTARVSSSRADTPPRPGDVMEYTVTGLNLTPGSSWQAATLLDTIDAKLELDADSVELSRNYESPDADPSLSTPAFYRGFDWDGLSWSSLPEGEYGWDKATLSKMVGSVYGGQSTSVRFQATVADGTGERPAPGDDPIEIENKPGGEGGYGKEETDLKPGEAPTDPTPLDPKTDIEVVTDPAPTPVLPKDPTGPDIKTTVTIDHKQHVEEHDDDRILVGDVLAVTVRTENVAPDTKLANAIMKATLPVGFELKPGTIVLTDAQGKTYPVPDSAYDPKTGIIAVNAGDLYGGEVLQLTFDVEVTEITQTEKPGGPEDPDNPDTPDNPDGPSGPDNPGGPGDPDNPESPDTPGSTRPTGPVIEGGTLGETPTDEWNRDHPLVPDPDDPDGPLIPGTPDEPFVKPTPGTPFVPTEPWEDLEDEYVTPEPAQPVVPPVLPSNPKLEDDEDGPADIKVEKAADNLDRDDGATHVGDTIRYTVTVSNAKPHSMWYDAVIRDQVPAGLEPLAGSIRVIGADGVTRPVPDEAYDVPSRTLAVTVGDLPGGKSATLIFEVLVEETAIGADLGNVADAFGTKPSDVDLDDVADGAERPEGGDPFVPEEGWDAFDKTHPSISNPEPTYPSPDVDAGGGVLPRDEGGNDGSGADGNGGAGGDNLSGKKPRTLSQLAQTGDATALLAIAALGLASVALTTLVGSRLRQR